MENLDTQEPKRLIRHISNIRRFLPALAFVGGFVWDTLTLGRVVTSSDLTILGLYYLGAYLGVILLGREWGEKARSRLAAGVQFCFGGLFSALVVFYFKSSGSLGGFLVVAALVLLLVANEFLHSRYARIGLSWSLLCLVGIMYFNFVLPHLVHGIGAFWFLLSTALACALLWLPWKISGRSPWHLAWPGSMALLAVVFYFVGIVPPVPLVVKQHLVCKHFERSGKEWSCMEPVPGLLAGLGLGPRELYRTPGEPLYYLSSVFAPSHVEALLEHRWYHRDASGDWRLLTTVPMAMVGGREEGWRLHSLKQNLEPGLWRVETALQGGAVVGRSEFFLPPSPEAEGSSYRKVLLH